MDMIQDWMIINKIKMGDPDAWDILVHKYYDSVYFYCVRRCYGDCDIASDLTQDIFLKFPLQYNHIQIYFLILVMQLVGIGFVESVTLLISALMHSSMSVLAVSLGVYILPLLLVQMIKTGVGNKILYLFPINNLNVQNILGILYSKDAFFFHSFFINIGFIFIFQFLIRVGMQLYCFIHIKHWKF